MKTGVLAAVVAFLVVVSFIGGYFTGQYTAGPVATTPTATQSPAPTPTPTPPATRKWRLIQFYVAGDPGYEAAKYFAGLVKEMSGGRIEIEVYYAGELGISVVDIVDAVSRGTVEIGMFYTSYLAAQDPVFALAGGAPGPMSNPYDVMHYAWETFDLVNATFSKFGVVAICPMVYGDVEILVSRVPVKSLKDIEGRVFRSSGLAAVFWSRLGLQTVMLPAGELYTALQLGTIDGLEWTDYVANYRMGFHEVAKYVIEPTPGYNLHSQATIHAYLIINPRVWQELPGDLKSVVRAACVATYQWTAYNVPKLIREYRQKWIDAGATIVQLPPEDLTRIQETAIQLYVEYAAKSPEAREFVNRLVRVWGDLGYTTWAGKLRDALTKAGLLRS
jgi:TRAP-type mannitol/chloroaromatic compound transport system substrate-binding protein